MDMIDNELYNKEHAATIDYVNTAIVDVWEKFQLLITQNIDKLDYVTRIITKEAEALRITKEEGASAYNYASRLLNAVNSMVSAFTNAGLDMTGITTEQFATCIDSLTNNNGCYIKGVSGTLYTPATWVYEKQRLGHDPELHEGIQVNNPDHIFLVASKNYSNIMYGTYSHTVPSLDAMTEGVAGKPKTGVNNSLLTLAATDPDLLSSIGWTKNYTPDMHYLDLLEDVYLVFFPDQTTLTNWATSEGLSKMVTIGTKMIYAIPHDEPGYYVLKYFNGINAISFANREAKAPYTDSYGCVGSLALTTAVEHREYVDDPDYGTDPNFWRLGSLFELLVCYLNKRAINECRTALDMPSLPESICWSVIQSNSNIQYYLSLADGSYSNPNKYSKCAVVPIASSLRQII